jgi:hypothetical protein
VLFDCFLKHLHVQIWLECFYMDNVLIQGRQGRDHEEIGWRKLKSSKEYNDPVQDADVIDAMLLLAMMMNRHIMHAHYKQ